MSDHEWCRDTARDEAVRAAEDAAAVPSIQHRDLPEQVALLWASLGDIIGRVVRLEGEMDAAREECERLRTERDDALLVLPACCGRLSDAAATVVQERDAAREECERLRQSARGETLDNVRLRQQTHDLRARVAELERAYSAECDARAQALRELSDLSDAIRDRESGEERDSSYAAQCREAAAARERADRMFPPPAADAVCDSASPAEGLRTERVTLEVTHDINSRPVELATWVRSVVVGKINPGESVRVVEEPAELALITAERDLARAVRDGLRSQRDAARARVAELEAAAPPRGWLTAEERDAVEEAMVDYASNVGDHDCERIERVLRALLARETPPRVRRPDLNVLTITAEARDRMWFAAIRAAGGEVE